MKLGIQIGLGPRNIVLDGDPAPSPQKKQFSAHVYCGQMAGWIKMVLGMEVGLSLGDFVLNGDRAPRKFSPMLIIVIVISLEHCTSRKALLVCSSSSSVFYAFYF